jgi:hypothetical protein
MDPWNTKEWPLGTQQHLPDIAQRNRRLRALSVALAVASFGGGALLLTALTVRSGFSVQGFVAPLLMALYGSAYARFCYRRSNDQQANLWPFSWVHIGREQSRAERSVHDQWFLVFGAVLVVLMLVWPVWQLVRALSP